ncbi:MAG: ferritin family protein [Desulfuromonadaceae bacterium]|nr:ferritin family protein [Desulfuromonadaceae bacterium]
MSKWNSVDEVLDFAIAREQEAVDFYCGLAKKVDSPALGELLQGFADEEMGHKEKLLGVKAGGALIGADTPVTDLKMADYLVDVEVGPDMSLAEILIVAMKREKAAFKLYTRLASMVSDPRVRKLFLALAQEEAKHKLRFEIEYDEYLTEG